MLFSALVRAAPFRIVAAWLALNGASCQNGPLRSYSDATYCEGYNQGRHEAVAEIEWGEAHYAETNTHDIAALRHLFPRNHWDSFPTDSDFEVYLEGWKAGVDDAANDAIKDFWSVRHRAGAHEYEQ